VRLTFLTAFKLDVAAPNWRGHIAVVLGIGAFFGLTNQYCF
jgi:hypothetical protein